MSREKKTTDDQSDRLRTWIKDRYEGRGMFSLLEADSLISKQRWKNMFYERQNATEEMLQFVKSVRSLDHDWIVSGLRKDGETYGFGTATPTSQDRLTITSRMNWVIKEWAAPRGKSLFEYLEEVSALIGEKISADDWAKVVLGRSEAIPEMLKVVSSKRPHFTVWMLTGDTYGQRGQVDPSSLESIKLWKSEEDAHLRKAIEDAAKFVKKT